MTERHAVLLLAYNQNQQQHELTVQALETILAQDIGPLDILLVDNGSTVIGTWEHFQMLRELYVKRNDETRIHTIPLRTNISPVTVTNRAMQYLFGLNHIKILNVANDVALPPNIYRLMDEWPRGFVTATPTDQKDYPKVESGTAHSEMMPTPVTLVRKWAHDALIAQAGYLMDENYFLYAVDCDLALRIIACGIHPIQINVPYYHYGSATWRLLPPEQGRLMTDRADVDRAYFQSKWGFRVDEQAYMETQMDLDFRGVRR